MSQPPPFTGFLHRLGTRLTLVTVLFFLGLAFVITLLVVYGFQQTQAEAVRRSQAGLEEQGRSDLLNLARSEANVSAGRLQPAIDLSQSAAGFMVNMGRMGVEVPWDSSYLTRAAQGFYYDANPNRRTEVIAKPSFSFNALTERELQMSSSLEGLFPAALDQYPDAAGIYYISPQGILRYYPVVDLGKLYSISDARQEQAFTQVMPSANPERHTIWLSAYVSNTGQGLTVTATTPVYDENRFLGAIGIDVTLDRIVAHLNDIKPTPGSYAFLVDQDGNLVAAPDRAHTDLFGPDPPRVVRTPGAPLNLSLTQLGVPALREIAETMRVGGSKVERVTLGGREVYVAYAPLSNIGWSLALVAPLSEITAQSETVAAAIRNDASTTVRFTLLVLLVLFLLSVVTTSTFSRRFLTRPIEALVDGVRAIAAGYLDVSLPVTSQDELGLLARSFNRMAGELKRRTEELAYAGANLREREAQYRSIFESTTDGLLINDLDGRLVDFNPAACRLHGYTPEEFRGLQPKDYIHPSYWEAFQRYIDTVKGGGEYRGRAMDVRKDGSMFYTEMVGAPFIYKGQPHSLAVMRDITEQVQAYQLLEQRVAERTRELSTLLELSHSVASMLELRPLLGLVLDQLKIMVDYDNAAIFIRGPVNGHGEQLVLAGQQGEIPAYAWQRVGDLMDDPGVQATALSFAEPVIVGDVNAASPEAEQLRSVLGDMLDSELSSLRSWMWVPLRIKDQVIGGLSLDYHRPNYYTPHRSRLALAIGSQAAVAIENARLYEQAQGMAALQERQRLARELHDSVSQALYGIALGARTARTLLERGETSPAASSLAAPLDYVLSLADAGLAEMRALIFELRPESLEMEGLVAALTKQTAALRARHALDVEADLCEEPNISLPAKEAFYRIAQEAMNNVVKHAQATRVALSLQPQAEDENGPACLVLRICDNGRGFDPGGSFPGHLGLKSMRERIERLGGALRIESAPTQGACITATLPLG